jgi:hypothetical protein
VRVRLGWIPGFSEPVRMTASAPANAPRFNGYSTMRNRA